MSEIEKNIAEIRSTQKEIVRVLNALVDKLQFIIDRSKVVIHLDSKEEV